MSDFFTFLQAATLTQEIVDLQQQLAKILPKHTVEQLYARSATAAVEIGTLVANLRAGVGEEAERARIRVLATGIAVEMMAASRSMDSIPAEVTHDSKN